MTVNGPEYEKHTSPFRHHVGRAVRVEPVVGGYIPTPAPVSAGVFITVEDIRRVVREEVEAALDGRKPDSLDRRDKA